MQDEGTACALGIVGDSDESSRFSCTIWGPTQKEKDSPSAFSIVFSLSQVNLARTS